MTNSKKVTIKLLITEKQVMLGKSCWMVAWEGLLSQENSQRI